MELYRGHGFEIILGEGLDLSIVLKAFLSIVLKAFLSIVLKAFRFGEGGIKRQDLRSHRLRGPVCVCVCVCCVCVWGGGGFNSPFNILSLYRVYDSSNTRYTLQNIT